MEPEKYFDGQALLLAKAIQNNRLDEVEQLAPRVELNRLYREGMTPLMWAMVVERLEPFDLLLKLGADPNLMMKDAVQPVALAAAVKDGNPFLAALLKNGGDPNSKGHTRPAIHIAFGREFYKNLDMLLQAGADINSQDEHDDTILIKAGYQNKFDKAIELIEKGADIHKVTDSGGGIALEVQEGTPKPGSVAYAGQARLKKLLMERGVKFPIFHPSAKPYAALLERWHQTPEGQQWQQKLNALGADPMGFGRAWQEVDEPAFAAFKAWMKANNVPEPERPKLKSLNLND